MNGGNFVTDGADVSLIIVFISSTMVLKLYGAPYSTCTRRVSTVLHEKKIPFELVVVDLKKGEHKAAATLANQPFGQLPYIVCPLFTKSTFILV
jgi:glutathione S-transferase